MPDFTGHAPNSFYKRILQVERAENAGFGEVFYTVASGDGVVSALEVSTTSIRVAGREVPQVVDAPADEDDMSTLPGAVAPASGVWMAFAGSVLWTLLGGETKWRQCERTLA